MQRLTIIRIAVIIFALLAALPVGVMSGCSSKITDANVARVEVGEVARRLDRGSNVLVIDARDEGSYRSGHLPKARHVRLPDIDLYEPTPEFEGYSMLIVYGDNRGSGTAMAMAKRLLAAKHKNVQLMEDGFERWRDEGLPIESGDPR